jgi:imidazole glycerol-phosphate synthase subunit HisH
MIGILDYGVGNVNAFLKIYKSLNIKAIPIKLKDDFKVINKIILPGVGSHDSTMKMLNLSGLRNDLDYSVKEKCLPLLGVCVGMHMLGKSSEEGKEPGLGYIDGVTKKFILSSDSIIKTLPHMGWNDISNAKNDFIWKNIDLMKGFYFLHSYYFSANNPTDIIATSNYENEFACAVKNKNIYGFQFHPEKSLSNGVELLRNFALL